MTDFRETYRRLAPAGERSRRRYLSSLLRIRAMPERIVARLRRRNLTLIVFVVLYLGLAYGREWYEWSFVFDILVFGAGVFCGLLRFQLPALWTLATAVDIIDWAAVDREVASAGLVAPPAE